MRGSLILLGLVVGLAAGAARAETGRAESRAEAAHAWRGQYCTPTGCGPEPVATAGSVLGFGAAALGAGWASRRRDRTPR